jgi:uncharacterized membrane protein YbhN (UPF0104 family)
MSNRTFVIVLLVVAALVGVAVVMHTPGGVRMLRSLHGR